jgi:hypothetical protein
LKKELMVSNIVIFIWMLVLISLYFLYIKHYRHKIPKTMWNQSRRTDNRRLKWSANWRHSNWNW